MRHGHTGLIMHERHALVCIIVRCSCNVQLVPRRSETASISALRLHRPRADV